MPLAICVAWMSLGNVFARRRHNKELFLFCSLRKDPVKVYKNLTDTAVTPLVRVLGGTWTDDVYTHNILAHPDTEDNSYTDIVNKTLNIASDGDAVTMKGKTLAIASVEDGSVTTINGKQLTYCVNPKKMIFYIRCNLF